MTTRWHGSGGSRRRGRSTSTSCPVSSAVDASSWRPPGVVDEARVERLLRSLSDDVAYLRDESLAGEDRRADPAWLRAVKYTFVTAIEAVVDVAQHFCATE